MEEAAATEMRALSQVFAHATAFTDTMLLKLAVQLGLADIIHAHTQKNPEGITLTQLAKSLPLDQVNINNLSRIMGCLVRMGLFSMSTPSQGQEDLFNPTHASEFILKDGKKSILPLIMLVMQEWAIAPWHFLDVALDGNNKNSTPFEKHHGCKLWEVLSTQPMTCMMFYEAMKAETMALIPGVIKVCDGTFRRIGSLIDVGGATGIGASSIAAEFPHVKCSVLDRPDVVASAKSTGCPNVEFLAGDMFASIPHADALLMKEMAIAPSPWHCLDAVLDGNNNNLTPFEKKHGCKLWEAFSKQRRMGKMFHDAMAAETMALIPGVIKVCQATFQRTGSLVDVGGAMGIGASSIAAEFPHVKCSVLDRPDVVAMAQLTGCPNVEFLPGDMFTSIPHADDLLVKKILHDWGDDECLKILQQCKKALPKEGGTLIIVEVVMGQEMDGDDAWGRVKITSDMGMLVYTGGKERTAEEWKLLLASAGFDIYKITPIMMGQSVIEAHPLH